MSVHTSVLTFTVVSGLVLLLVYAISALAWTRRTRRSSEKEIWVSLPLATGFEIPVPESWECVHEPQRLLLKSGKKDGLLEVAVFPKNFHAEPLETLLTPHLHEWDRPFHQETLSPELSMIEGAGRDPQTGERKYCQLYRWAHEDVVVLAFYKSSVLFGFADGYQIEHMLRHLRPTTSVVSSSTFSSLETHKNTTVLR